MNKSNVIIFPNQRTPFVALVRHWYARGYHIGQNRRGRLILLPRLISLA